MEGARQAQGNRARVLRSLIAVEVTKYMIVLSIKDDITSTPDGCSGWEVGTRETDYIST